jgi:3-phenylpropionate/cinnamic acid dioxygenase small subunit
VEISNTRNIVNELQLKYAFAIDRKDMRGWLACFAEDGSYLCQTRENFQDNLPIGYMWDDRYARLQDRVKTITEVWAGTAEDYQPRHVVQGLHVEDAGDGMIDAISNFVVFYTTNRGDSQILTTGEYHDRVRIVGTQASFVAKKAILDQITVPRYLVYPI